MPQQTLRTVEQFRRGATMEAIPPTPSPTRDVLRELFARLADGGFDASSLLTLVLLATCLTFAVGVLLRHPRI